MGIHMLPQINNYMLEHGQFALYICSATVNDPWKIFWELWANLHLVDNETAAALATGGLVHKPY